MKGLKHRSNLRKQGGKNTEAKLLIMITLSGFIKKAQQDFFLNKI